MGEQLINIIIFAGFAGFLAYRLWSVLGRRTGAERPPRPSSALRPKPMGDNIIPLPGRPRPVQTVADPAVTNAAGTDPLQAGLAAIRAADPAFRPEGFIDGARHAFEMIVKAFADGDTAKLRPLVSDEVYDTFAEAIRARLASQETVDTKVTRLADPVLIEAWMDGRTALVTAKFVSSQISVTRSHEGQILEGDPERAIERIDHWTFSRNTRSSDPNWFLVGTGTPE
jgi:predicted lipid-binding transport protein (Tim44 family)